VINDCHIWRLRYQNYDAEEIVTQLVVIRDRCKLLISKISTKSTARRTSSKPRSVSPGSKEGCVASVATDFVFELWRDTQTWPQNHGGEIFCENLLGDSITWRSMHPFFGTSVDHRAKQFLRILDGKKFWYFRMTSRQALIGLSRSPKFEFS
jgi:hypothetical protein